MGREFGSSPEPHERKEDGPSPLAKAIAARNEVEKREINNFIAAKTGELPPPKVENSDFSATLIDTQLQKRGGSRQSAQDVLQDTAKAINESTIQDAAKLLTQNLASLFPSNKREEFLKAFSPQQMKQMVQATAKLIKEADIDIGFDMLNGVDVAKQFATERGVSPEAVYKDDALYKEYMQKRWTPDTYGSGILYALGEKFDPEKQGRTLLNYQTRLKAIEGDYGDTAEESLEHAVNAELAQQKRKSDFVSQVDQTAAAQEDLITSFTRSQIERFWGKEALNTLPEKLRSRLASSNPEMEQVDLAEGYAKLAGSLFEHDRFEEALHPAQKAVDLDPNTPYYKSALGLIHLELGNHETAKKHIVKAIELDPEDPYSTSMLGAYNFKTENFEEAVNAYKKAIGLSNPKENKQTLTACYDKLAQSLRKLERYQEALHPAQKAVELDPDNPDRAHNLANTYEGLGMNEEELKLRHRVVELAPTSSNSWSSLGEVQNRLGMPDDAKESYSISNALQEERDPQSAKYKNLLGNAQLKNGNYKKAAENFYQAMGLEPNNAKYVSNLGNAQVMQENFEEAAEAFQKAVELSDPETPPEVLADRYDDLGRSLWTTGRPDEALESLHKATGLAPENAVYRNLLGWMYVHTENYEAAEANYTTATELDPQNPLRFQNLAEFYEHIGNHSEALEAFDQAVTLDPSDPNNWYHRGNIHLELKNYESAEKDLTQVTRLAPQVADGWDKLGYAQIKLGKIEKALLSHKEATRLDPEDPMFWNNLGCSQMELKDYNDAQQSILKAIALNPEKIHYRISLGEIHYAMGQYQQAEKDWHQAIDMDQHEAEPYYYLALTQEKLDKSDAAKASLQQALEKADPENEQELIEEIRRKMDELS